MRLTTLKVEKDAHDDAIWCASWIGDSAVVGDGQVDTGLSGLVTGSVDESCKQWTFDRGQQTLNVEQNLTNHDLGVISLGVDPSHEIVATTALDCCVRMWNMKTEENTYVTLEGPEAWSLAFNPLADSQQLAVAAGSKGGVTLYTTRNLGDDTLNRQVAHMKGPSGLNEGGVSAPKGASQATPFAMGVAYDPRGVKLAVSHSDGQVVLYDVETQKEIRTYVGHSKAVRSLCFSSDEQLLITASDDGTSNLYEMMNKNPISNLTGHEGSVLSVAGSRGGKHCVTGSADGKVKVWELRTTTCLQTLSEHQGGAVWDVAMHPTRNLVTSVGDDGCVVVYSAAD